MGEEIGYGLRTVYVAFHDDNFTSEIPGAVNISLAPPKLKRQDIRKLRKQYDPLAIIGTGYTDYSHKEDYLVVRCFLKKTHEVIGDFMVRAKDLRANTWDSDAMFLAKVKAYEYLKEQGRI